jgi:hypothetical protein
VVSVFGGCIYLGFLPSCCTLLAPAVISG